VRVASPSKQISTPTPSPASPNPLRTQLLSSSPSKRLPSLNLQPKPTLSFQSPVQQPHSPSPVSPRKPGSSGPPSQSSPKDPPSILELSGSISSKQLSPRPSSSLINELPTPPPPEQPPLPVIHDDTELQELRAKVRVLEAKRSDDARHVRELETKLSEAESFVALRPKLQTKLASLQTQLIATKRELADVQQLSSLEGGRVADAQEQLEMATLDKEMAEERAEIAEAELEEVREKLAVLEVEAEVLRSGGGGDDGTNEATTKASMAYIQLEKQNERLKEALMKLRDISQQTDQEQRRRISEMEKDVASFEELQCEFIFRCYCRQKILKPLSAI
jgi:dynactin 1